MNNERNSRFQESEPSPGEDITIRDMASKLGISYAEARQKWEMMKAASNLQAQEKREEEEENNNG